MSRVIEVEGLDKVYRRMAPGFRLRTLKSALLERSLVAGLEPEEAVSALSDVSFTVAPGQAFGIVGGNGSGKSTLLKVVAGILKPTRGRVRVRGRVAALIELGAGFHPEISGRENVFINGAVLGLSRREVERQLDAIVDFSGLGDFIDEPVKTYSSGMYMRLGFSVAVHTDPDVLLVDEVLAVGDEAFAHRCLRRIEEHLAAGRSLLFVSHALSLVESLCDRVMWLERGRARMVGEPRRVVDGYRQAVAEEEGRQHRREKEEAVPAEEGEASGERLRWGSREAVVTEVRMLVAGKERHHLQSGEEVAFELVVEAPTELDDFVFGIGVFTPRGVECWGTNTDLRGAVPQRLAGRVLARVRCPELRLAAGEYLLDVAVHARDGAPYDYRRRVLAFTVTRELAGVGVYAPRHRWEFEGPVAWRQAP